MNRMPPVRPAAEILRSDNLVDHLLKLLRGIDEFSRRNCAIFCAAGKLPENRGEFVDRSLAGIRI
jgi:hypothetical protein